jgi:hypothetical protein
MTATIFAGSAPESTRRQQRSHVAAAARDQDDDPEIPSATNGDSRSRRANAAQGNRGHGHRGKGPLRRGMSQACWSQPTITGTREMAMIARITSVRFF